MSKRNFSVAAAAVVIAGGLSLTTANAADLGGDCCADLEERVAELEATTVRKGNSKVSLKISGWIQQQIMWWDDGDLDNVYVQDQGTTLASNLNFSGSAKINSDMSAGFQLQIEYITENSFGATQAGPGDPGGVAPLTLFWWLKSEQLGKISVGKISQASDNAAILADSSGANLIMANWVFFDGAAFQVRPKGATGLAGLADATWGDFGFCHHIGAGIGADCNGVPRQGVRYDSPTIAGFSASASWGPDDFWDVAARYRGTMGDINLSVDAAFSSADADLSGAPIDSDYFQIGAGLKHTPTGLFIYGAYGMEENDTVFAFDAVTGATKLPDGDHWYLKGGVQQKWSSLGATTIYGEYGEHEDMALAGFSDGAIGSEVCADIFGLLPGCGISIGGSTIERWGFGIQQDIDAAAMALYVKYRHHELDVSFVGDTDGLEFEDWDTLIAGGIIHF